MKMELRAIQHGESQTLRVLRVGDSLAGRISQEIERQVLTKWFPGAVYASDSKGRGGIYTPTYPSGLRYTKSDYSLTFVGSYILLPIEGGFKFSAYQSGDYYAPFLVDRLKIPYLKESGSGSFRVKISGENPLQENVFRGPELTNGELVVNADGSGEMDWIELRFDSVQSHIIDIEHVSGSEVRFLHPTMEITTEPTVNFYHLGEGSNNFINIEDSSVVVMARLIEMLEPDIILTQSDDELGAYENMLPKLKSAIDLAGLETRPAVILVGEGPKLNFSFNYDYTLKIEAANAYQRAYAAEQGWSYIDLMGIANDMDTLLARGLAGDGVHLDRNFYLLGAQIGACGLGLYPSDDALPVLDLDGDSLSDLNEYLLAGSHPLLADTDSDGLEDDFEAQAGLSPRISIATTLEALGSVAPQLLMSNSLISVDAESGVTIGFQIKKSTDLINWNPVAPQSVHIDGEHINVGLGEVQSESEFYRIGVK
ncbi:SGNH/GDSL hydrolase family protein [Cerasicoccus arenae]|uniref:SGNH/GDSL hydrolase family protein n=1 Tax=Cerasicoccus arenae TaxID=424488 RepID=UPI00366CF6FB